MWGSGRSLCRGRETYLFKYRCISVCTYVGTLCMYVCMYVHAYTILIGSLGGIVFDVRLERQRRPSKGLGELTSYTTAMACSRIELSIRPFEAFPITSG